MQNKKSEMMKSEYMWIIFKIRALLQSDSISLFVPVMACVTSQVECSTYLLFLFCPRERDNPACYC